MSKLAVVTGASGGIGNTIALRLIQEGYHVIAMGRNNEKLCALRDHVPLPNNISLLSGDIRRCADPLRAMLVEMGPPDLLVCAHGASPVTAPTIGMPSETFFQVLHTDVYGTWVVCQTVGESMVQHRHGSIVLISSLHAYMTYPQRTLYAMSKSSVCALARALAVEWGQYNIRINSISPWQTYGERTQNFIEKEYKETGEDLLEYYYKKSPLRMIVSPEDIAETVLYLMSNKSITGQDIILDCGVSSSLWYRGFEAPHG